MLVNFGLKVNEAGVIVIGHYVLIVVPAKNGKETSFLGEKNGDVWVFSAREVISDSENDVC